MQIALPIMAKSLHPTSELINIHLKSLVKTVNVFTIAQARSIFRRGGKRLPAFRFINLESTGFQKSICFNYKILLNGVVQNFEPQGPGLPDIKLN